MGQHQFKVTTILLPNLFLQKHSLCFGLQSCRQEYLNKASGVQHAGTSCVAAQQWQDYVHLLLQVPAALSAALLALP